MCIKSGSDKVLPGRALVAAGRRIQSEPVSIMCAAGPQIRCFGGAGDIVDPALHTVKLIFQNLRITVGQVDFPRADDCSVSPCSAAIRGLQKIRDDMPDAAVVPLVRSHVCEPFCEKLFRIIIHAGCPDEDLCVSSPAKPFIPLRTIGWYIDKIALLSPYNIREKLVQKRIRAAQVSGAFHFRVNDDGSKILRLCKCRSTRKCIDPDITESKKGKMRMPGLTSVTAGVMQLCLCGTIVFRIKISVTIHDFCMRERNDISTLCINRKLDISGQLLPEVDDRLTGRGSENTGWRNTLLLVNLHSLLWNQAVPWSFQHMYPVAGCGKIF